jgi:hypothetical protein
MHYIDILTPLYEAHGSGSIRDAARHWDVPTWVVPYEIDPVQSGFSYGTSLLTDAVLQAGKHANIADDEALRQAYADTAVAIGERFGAQEWRAAYIGIPLLAAHIAARGIVAGMAEADELWDDQFAGGLDRFVWELWPAPDKAAHPATILHVALALRRRMAQCGLGEVRCLEDLVKLGTVDASRYPVAVMHLLRTVVRNDMHISARERRGKVIAEMLKP